MVLVVEVYDGILAVPVYGMTTLGLMQRHESRAR